MEYLAGWDITIHGAMEVARPGRDEVTLTYARIGEDLYCFTSGDGDDVSRFTGITSGAWSLPASQQ